MDIVFYCTIIFSIIGLGAIVCRKTSVLASLSKEEMAILDRKKGFFGKVREIDYKRHGLNFVVGLEKLLRRVKIVFLKVENLLTSWIKSLSNKSRLMNQKSREWIRQRELQRRSKPKCKGGFLNRFRRKEREEDLPAGTGGIDNGDRADVIVEDDDLPLSELKKPIQEEQKWIDLIVENPRNITAYKFLGLLYWKQHNYADAKASLEMAVKLGSKDKKVLEILKELRKIDVEGE